MLPFPRISEYGNVAKNWYTGSNVVLAFDSNNFIPNTNFNDYKSKIISIDKQNASSPNPTLNTGVASPYGSGIALYGALLVAGSSQIPPSFSTSSFTIDMWYSQSSTAGIEFIPYGMYRQLAPNDNKYLLWFYGVDTQGMRYQNNGANIIRPKSNYSSLFTSTWKHIAYVYDSTSNMNYFFINGILVDSFTYTVASPASATICGVGGHVNSPSGTVHSIVERVRFRTGAVWTENFDINNIYPI
ncbi:hypothetical protein pEaSNUABM50_00567 [Erwinia phage pEa_SNUABM_50]|uniref:Uncharacterized protein n=2 Tax=Eneladusvirus BF TaxID=2560751 RepID=A0A7L8ZP11_9CAUD|nr:hypothetical protein pEaSNUABM47_00568 [Erwinia phage pEa_SNUABM_47]QOI72557.1 hypothetical protein pEaSNUABM50_00567 [Erwinia phage pEa_SNUABM_50]QXO12238.1 hypothetical protein pEaSNUABM44_00577 [Erwinia phage pEa_SNUABM_44]QXO12793.1 hypothetical protein pEaSNUABM49_00580 [Erwinia phage pEa_SNUABM_49]